jgi:hypothetical protein
MKKVFLRNNFLAPERDLVFLYKFLDRLIPLLCFAMIGYYLFRKWLCTNHEKIVLYAPGTSQNAIPLEG